MEQWEAYNKEIRQHKIGTKEELILMKKKIVMAHI